MSPDRAAHLDALHRILRGVAQRHGGPRRLDQCDGRTGWPRKGVYFFFEDGETRANGEPRVVRVGTHAVAGASATSLWSRLRAHRGRLGGRNPGGGNHRASIFRYHVGEALLAREGATHPTWGVRDAPREARAGEREHERRVSRHIGAMPLVWLDVPDDAIPGLTESPRAWLERNAIALLSNAGRAPVDTPSEAWLGNFSRNSDIRGSGLWNVRHVRDVCDPTFLSHLARLADASR